MLFVTVLAAWAWVLPRLRVDMSIAHFLPRTDAAAPQLAGLLRALAEGELAATTVIDIGSDSGAAQDSIVETATKLQVRLRSSPTTRRVRSGIDENEQHALADFMLRYPAASLLPKAEFEPPELRRRVESLKEELAGPLGPVVRSLAPRDPLGAQLGLLRALENADGAGLRSRDGILLSHDGSHGFLFLTPEGNAFDADLQRRILSDIQRGFEEVRTTPTLRLELGGVARYAIHSEEHIRGDIERIGTLSTLGILALFFAMFRSARMLLLGLVPLVFGTMLATLGSYAIFGSVHGLTLAFGASLLGVGIDYAEHYFTHFALEPELGAQRVMRHVWPGLWMGALTTIAGLSGLAFADFPGAIEMAVFASLAVFGAIVGTRVLLPPWMPERYRTPALAAKLARVADVVVRFFRARSRWAFLPIVVTIVFGAGIARTRFIDDMSGLLAMDPNVAAEDERVRKRVTRADPGRFAVVMGDDESQALDRLSLAHAELESAKRAGILGHFVPLGAILRSPGAQADSVEAAKASLDVLKRALTEEGFRPELFAPYEAALGEDAPPMTLAALQDSPLGSLVRPLTPRIGSQQAILVPLGGVRSLEALRAHIPHATILDERSLLDDTYGHVRKRVALLLVLGLAFVLVLLVVRYRSLRLAAAALLPAVAAAITTVACLAWLAIPLSVMHVMALSLVLSMGVDYGIFVVEGRASPETGAPSIVGILTATVTTLLSFGLLALSQNPALRAIGMTTAIGMTAAFLLSPAALVVLAPQPSSGR